MESSGVSHSLTLGGGWRCVGRRRLRRFCRQERFSCDGGSPLRSFVRVFFEIRQGVANLALFIIPTRAAVCKEINEKVSKNKKERKRQKKRRVSSRDENAAFDKASPKDSTTVRRSHVGQRNAQFFKGSRLRSEIATEKSAADRNQRVGDRRRDSKRRAQRT